MILDKCLCIVTSKGGHLSQILKLQKLFKDINHYWITFKSKDVSYYLKREKKFYAHYPETRHLPNAILNLYLAWKIFKKHPPNFIISSGAGIAIPFLIIGKVFFGSKLIYIESYDYIAYPSLTGKIAYKFVDLFIIQHTIQKKWYPNAKYWGSLL